MEYTSAVHLDGNIFIPTSSSSSHQSLFFCVSRVQAQRSTIIIICEKKKAAEPRRGECLSVHSSITPRHFVLFHIQQSPKTSHPQYPFLYNYYVHSSTNRQAGRQADSKPGAPVCGSRTFVQDECHCVISNALCRRAPC